MPEIAQDHVFALDIGTRSIVGVLGREENGRLRVLDIDKEEHGRRAMLDGQIEDIAQVALIAKHVMERLEERQHVRLKKVCVAAAGRALKSAKASFTLEFSEPRLADDETISQLEAGAVSAAESVVADGSEGTFYMVGYTASQYRLDGYPMSTLHGHRGRVLEADVVATFLPREVVDSLYAVVARLGLEVSSLTLEPIASLNAAIPVDIRLLNLVLVDIGAGTSDIAICRDGSVTGYTMATVAGDEITELLMKKLLVDFQTGEMLKMGLGGADPLQYTDILGLPHECTSEMLAELIEPAVQLLAGEIAQRVLELNGAAPSAVFLAGGGSKLHGLRQAVAQALEMDDTRVAIAGNHFEKNAFSDQIPLNDPEFSTPLGIAVSAALGMIHDSYVVTLNGLPAKLFRSGTLNVRDILLMNGCNYGDMMGRTGANLAYTVNGERQFLRGAHGTPPVIRLNGAPAELSTLVHAGDSLQFTPAQAGKSAARTLEEALGGRFTGGVTVNGAAQPLSYQLRTGDVVETGEGRPVPLAEPVTVTSQPAPKLSAQEPLRARATVHTAWGETAVDVPVKRLRQEKRNPPVEEASRPLDGQLDFEGTQSSARPARPRVRNTVQRTGAATRTVGAAEENTPSARTETRNPQAAETPLQAEAHQSETAARPEISAPQATEAPSQEEARKPQAAKTAAQPETPALQAAETPTQTEAYQPQTASVQRPRPVPGPAPKRRGVPRVILPDLPGLGLPHAGLTIRMNGKPLTLPPKENGEPYYFMDILQYSGLDFGRLERPVELLRNGAPCEFTQVLAGNDDVVVRYQE